MASSSSSSSNPIFSPSFARAREAILHAWRPTPPPQEPRPDFFATLAPASHAGPSYQRVHPPEIMNRAFQVARRELLSSLSLSLLTPLSPASAEPAVGFREYIDNFDGYTFLYPKSWIQVRGAGADVFFRDPIVLDENISVEISSPSSSRYSSVEDLGSPEKAAEKVLRQYLTEFMSTRLGVKRESNVLSASQRVADDGKIYYQVEVNIKSYASNNELAVMPQDRVQKLEWDRRYLSVLGVENKRLYELRLQTPEKVFQEEEKDLRAIMDSFRAFKSVD
ncbi:hypothetical protein LUZ60_010236 [Juncus effusus]|nr:hypothetical protein LUZ60_010236 [Juncus effusus]